MFRQFHLLHGSQKVGVMKCFFSKTTQGHGSAYCLQQIGWHRSASEGKEGRQVCPQMLGVPLQMPGLI